MNEETLVAGILPNIKVAEVDAIARILREESIEFRVINHIFD